MYSLHGLCVDVCVCVYVCAVSGMCGISGRQGPHAVLMAIYSPFCLLMDLHICCYVLNYNRSHYDVIPCAAAHSMGGMWKEYTTV